MLLNTMIELTNFIVQHFLQDVKLNMIFVLLFVHNHTRHSIKIHFVKKKIGFINLPSIFKDNMLSLLLISMESPITTCTCYRHSNHIRSTIFNYNTLVTELDIETTIRRGS